MKNEIIITVDNKIWPMNNGKAEIKHYPVFPGADLYINDISGYDLVQGYTEPPEAVEINFCTAGKYELFCGDSTRIILQDGDFSVNITNPSVKEGRGCRFPTGNYKGVELLIYPEQAEKWCRENLPAFSVSFSEIISQTLENKWVRFGKASLQCEHISRELYAVNSHSSLMWIQLKVLELMMVLTTCTEKQMQEYIPTDRVQLARHLRDHIIGLEPGEFSLERIAHEHKLSVSQMQRIFKSVYQQSIYHYFKQYRLEAAAEVLQNTNISVEEIALSAGYQSTSKFAAAFKTQFGITPLTFRHSKTIVQNGFK